VQRDRERLEHRPRGVIQIRRQHVALIGADGNVLRKCAIGGWPGARAAEHDGRAAEVAAPRLAVIADPARAGRIRGDPRADRQVLHSVADRGDLRREFVAEHERAGRHKRAAAPVLEIVQVGAADAGAANAQQHHPRLQFGRGPGLDFDRLGRFQYGGAHGGGMVHSFKAR